MTKLKALLLTEGLHGMISQTEGLAKALNFDYIHEKIELNSFWKLIPTSFTPVKKFVFKNQIEQDFDVIISCGRKSIIPSLFLKKKSKKKIINIHIQNPKISLNHFDFVVCPEHDNIKGSNVLSTKGAIPYLTHEEINNSKDYLLNKLDRDKDVITLILGGPNKYYNYSDENMISIFSIINRMLKEHNLQLVVIPSNRTPKKTIELSKEYFTDNRTVIDVVDKSAYLSSLALSKYLVVTCDSTSMISEAALTGKPVYVAMIPALRNDKRCQRFRSLFEKLNIIKILENKLETWNYEKLNEADRIALEIKRKIN